MKALKAIVRSPSFAGALVVLGLAAYAGRRVAGDDAGIGTERRVEAIEYFVAKRFAGEIARMKIGILATAVALGIVIGLVVEVLVRLRYSRAGIARRLVVRAFVENAFACLVVHAAFVAWGMADSPQLYAARWYAAGGIARTAQVFATDVLGTRGVVAIAVVGALLYVRPRRIARGIRRAGEAWVTRGRAGIGVGAVGTRVVAGCTFVGRRVAGPVVGLAVAAVGVWAAGAGDANADANAHADANANAHANANANADADARRPNILVIAADSLRADRLDARVAPNLVGLAGRGTTFGRAYVSLPRTFPSWVTILTGRHAHHHGIRSMFPTWEERARDFDALPQRLAKSGYATGVVSDYAGDIFTRIDLGFGRVDAPAFDFRQIVRQRALERETPLLPLLHSRVGRRLFPVMREMNDAADPALLGKDAAAAIRATRGRPFFLTVFFSTAHFPYAAPSPFYAKYTDRGYRGRFKYHKPVGLDDERVDDADVKQIRALYDGSVAALDASVGRLLAMLEKEGMANDTIIVVTSDHGETLYENGRGQGHGNHLFGDEGTHVPLVIVDPRRSGGQVARRENGIVRDVDIAATLYELAGVAPPSDLDGRSLVPAIRGKDVEPRLAFAETELWFTEDIAGVPAEQRLPYPGIMALTEIDAEHGAEIVMRRDMSPITRMARHRMVRDAKWKLVYVPARKGVRYMLFDTLADPAEMHDVASAHPREVERLKTELWTWMLQDPQMEQKDGYLVPRSPGGTP